MTHAERTFWEKATAIHVFCLQEGLRGDRFSRHWHDIARRHDMGLADSALIDREFANAVARRKSIFFTERAADRLPVDYQAAINGELQLTPTGEGQQALRKGFVRMVEVSLLFDNAETFEAPLERCAVIYERANANSV